MTSDENATGPDGGNRGREFLLKAPSPERATKGSIRLRSEAAAGGSRKSEGSSSHGAHAPEGNRGSSTAGEKLGKVKLKIRNVLPKPNPDTPPAKPPRPVDSRHQQKHGHLVSASNYVFILYCACICTKSPHNLVLGED